MRMMVMMVAAASAAMLAVPASAATYRFDVVETDPSQTGLPGDNEVYSFVFDSMPVPVTFTADSFSLAGTILLASGSSITSDFTFLIDSSFGGVTTRLGSYSDKQLFTGDTSAPIFKLGSFVLDEATVSITDLDASAGPVPEPAAWATMIAGFGLVGASLRSRRTRTSVRFAG